MDFALYLACGLPLPLAAILHVMRLTAAQAPPRRGPTHEFRDPMTRDDVSDEEFFRTFRFRRGDIARVAAALRLPEYVVTRHGHRATREVALLYLLYKYAQPRSYADCQRYFGPDESTISRIVLDVETHVHSSTARRHLASFHPTLVTRAALARYAAKVSAKLTGFPDVWALVDGCAWEVARADGSPVLQRVAVKNTGDAGAHCFGCQAVVAPDGLILHLSGLCEGGQVHDDLRALAQSEILDKMEAHPGKWCADSAVNAGGPTIAARYRYAPVFGCTLCARVNRVRTYRLAHPDGTGIHTQHVVVVDRFCVLVPFWRQVGM